MGELFHSYPGTNYQIPPDLDSVVQNPLGAVLHLPQEADKKEKYFQWVSYKKIEINVCDFGEKLQTIKYLPFLLDSLL